MEVVTAKIRGLYGEIKGILGPIKDSTGLSVQDHVVNTYNSLVDELISVSEGNYIRSKIPLEYRKDPSGKGRYLYSGELVKPIVSGLMCKLEEEYGFGRNQSQPSVVLVNKNMNKTSIDISYTIQTLIEDESDEDTKAKLIELEEALKNKDKSKITEAVKWILDKSFDIFIQVLPIIIQNYGK